MINERVNTKDSIDTRGNFLKIASAVVFWGSLWGLIEATIGYGLHLLHIRGVTSFFLFPMACYYMDKVRKQASSQWAILYMALLAAGIKLLDFFIPGNDPIRIIFPSIAIVLEGMAVFGAFMFVEKKERKFGYLEALFVSSAWRIVFTLLQFATLPQAKVPSSQSVIKFIIVDSLVNSALIYLYTKLIKPREDAKKKVVRQINPIASVIVLVLTILSKWVI